MSSVNLNIARMSALCAACLLVSCALANSVQVALTDKNAQDLKTWFATDPDQRLDVAELHLPKAMSKQQADSILVQLVQLQKENQTSLEGLSVDLPKQMSELIAESKANKTKLAIEAKKLHLPGEFVMPYVIVNRDPSLVGERSLYICTHGGGTNTKTESAHGWPINTREFQTQIKMAIALYKPQGLYFVPRMADDRKGRWWYKHNQVAYDSLIDHAILHWGVNPNRVYFLGISEGGYGTDIMAPWMGDRFAGANAMAAGVGVSGNPPANLRNVAFRTDVGEKDTTFKRCPMAIDYHKALDKLQQNDPDGYTHSINVQAGKGHGIDYRPGIEWISEHSRNAWPKRVVWHSLSLDGNRRHRFYWLALPDAPAKGRFELDASVDSATNTITVSAEEVIFKDNDGNKTHGDAKAGERKPIEGQRLRLLLNDALLDLDKPVTVVCNGNTIYNGKVVRSAAQMLEELAKRADPVAVPTAILDLEIK